ncbi:hypothetical protein Hamer_G016024, partial [Homarus americanus]
MSRGDDDDGDSFLHDQWGRGLMTPSDIETHLAEFWAPQPQARGVSMGQMCSSCGWWLPHPTVGHSQWPPPPTSLHGTYCPPTTLPGTPPKTSVGRRPPLDYLQQVASTV